MAKRDALEGRGKFWLRRCKAATGHKGELPGTGIVQWRIERRLGEFWTFLL